MKKGKAPGEYVWEKDGSVMVRFPGGRYNLGHKNYRNGRWVEIEEFYIDKYEVSKERYRAFLKAKRKDRDPGRWEHPKAREEGASHFRGTWSDTPDGGPVIHVSWYKAWSFARWAGKSLPTGEEWEAAASWDTTAGKRGNFPWGKGFQMEWANTKELWEAKGKVEGKPMPCGSFPKDRSPCGCMDMAGNVKEWCLYDALPPVTPFMPRTETHDGRMKVLRFMEEMSLLWRPVRGGCFAHPYVMAQAQIGETNSTDSGWRWIGFRCVYRPEGWKTFARLARDAGIAGRPKEAAMLIGELKIAPYAVDAVVGAFRGLFEDFRIAGEKAEAEGKFAEALDLYLLALQVVPDAGRENEMNGRVRRVRQWGSVLQAADAALEGRSRSALEKALADLGEVIGTFPDTKAASMARERILRVKERLASLPSGEGEDEGTIEPRGLDEILEMLASKDSSRRKRGKYALRDWDENPKESVLILIRAFQARFRFMSFSRYSLLQSIARLGAAAGGEEAEQAANVLVKALRDRDSQMRSYARSRIGALGPHGAPGVKILLSIIAQYRFFPMEIAQSLGEIGPKAKAALPVLRAHLEKRKPEAEVEDPSCPDTEVLIAFRRIATQKDVEDSIPLLLSLAKEPKGKLACEALETLSRLPRPTSRVLSVFSKAIRGGDEKVRASAIMGLAEFRKRASSAFPALVSVLQSSSHSWEDRSLVASTLGALGPRARPAMPIVLQRLRENKLWPSSAAKAIAGQGSAGRPFLVEFEKAMKETKRRFIDHSLEPALQCLQVALGKKPHDALVSFLGSRDSREREEAAVCLELLGPGAKDAIPDLLKGLGDPEASVRQACMSALGRIGDASKPVEEALRKALYDPKVDMREKAFRALETLGLWKD